MEVCQTGEPTDHRVDHDRHSNAAGDLFYLPWAGNSGTSRLIPSSESPAYLPTPDTGDFHNGSLAVNVVNSLTTPASTEPISVNVYVSMCDDYKFGSPRFGLTNNLHLFPEQDPVPPLLSSQAGSGDITDAGTGKPATEDAPTGPQSVTSIVGTGPEADMTYSVFFGEDMPSIRDLLKRYCFMRYESITDPTDVSIYTLTMADLPWQSGFDPDGLEPSSITGNPPISVVGTTPTAWFLPCYAGWRGGLRRKILAHTGTINSVPLLVRGLFRAGVLDYGTSETLVDSTAPATLRQTLTAFFANSWNGSAPTILQQNGAVEVEFPFYDSRRFASARQKSANKLDCPYSTYREVVVASQDEALNDANPKVNLRQVWQSVGDDFSLFFFTGVPIYYYYNMPF